MDLSMLSDALTRGANGIWTTGAAAGGLSFPDHGHAACFRVEDESFWFHHRNELIARALRRHPFEGAFLDVGGGNGVVSQYLARRGISTVMLEPGPEGAGHARRRGLENVVCATLEDAAFRPGSFGAVGLFDVIEHVEDDAALLTAARQVLLPGAVLAVTVPAYEWLWSSEDDVAGHFRRYTLGSLQTVLARTGFDVQWSTYFFAALTAPIFVARSLRHRFGRRSEEAALDAAVAQHTPSKPARLVMDALLAPELRAVARGRRIPFGSSCLAIARVSSASAR